MTALAVSTTLSCTEIAPCRNTSDRVWRITRPLASRNSPGRTVALFAVPGAFTPTCSAKHLPGFIEKADELAGKGVDEIVCVSVNDPFVMGAWGKSTGADGKITMLADGNGDFAKALGLTMDGSRFGMGLRSQRFSMLVKDGKVTELNVEEPGAFKVSSAEHLLSQL
jgi:peroxiredoxin